MRTILHVPAGQKIGPPTCLSAKRYFAILWRERVSKAECAAIGWWPSGYMEDWPHAHSYLTIEYEHTKLAYLTIISFWNRSAERFKWNMFRGHNIVWTSWQLGYSVDHSAKIWILELINYGMQQTYGCGKRCPFVAEWKRFQTACIIHVPTGNGQNEQTDKNRQFVTTLG